jgi:predicted phage terminase large subunit-like protein
MNDEQEHAQCTPANPPLPDAADDSQCVGGPPGDWRDTLEDIAWKIFIAMPGRVPDAPLNHLTTAAGFMLDRLETIKRDRSQADAEPLYFSRLTDAELQLLIHCLALLLGDSSGPAVREGSCGEPAGHSLGAEPAAGSVEPLLPAAPLRTAGEPPDSADLPELHRWLNEQLHSLHERRGAKLAVIAPRESAKTTWVSLAYVLRCAVEGREPYILLLSDSEDQAEQFLAAIRTELGLHAANEAGHTLAAIYPEACGEGPEWRRDHLLLNNGVLIESLGRGSKIRGRKNRQHRPTLIVIDDCQSNRDILSLAEREKTLKWFTQEVLPCGSSSTNFISVGSALHRDAVAVRAQSLPGWTGVTFAAIVAWPERMDLWREWELLATNLADPNRHTTAANYYAQNQSEMDRGGVSFWPSFKPLPVLMMKRAEIGHRQFLTEYQGQPDSPEGAEWPGEYFDRPDFLFTDWPRDVLFTIIALDPSKGRADPNTDYQAVAIIMLSRDGKLWVDCECHREPVADMVARAVELARHYRPHSLAVETNQGLDLLIPEFERFMAAARLTVPLQSVQHYSTSKVARIRRLGPYLSRGQIRVRNTAGGRILLDQLRDFPNGAHDDAPDALEIGVRRLELLTSGA